MTVKFIESEKTKTMQLRELPKGCAFVFTDSYYIVSDEEGDDGDKTTRCINVSDDVGYIAHFFNDLEVIPVTLVISRES